MRLHCAAAGLAAARVPGRPRPGHFPSSFHLPALWSIKWRSFLSPPIPPLPIYEQETASAIDGAWWSRRPFSLPPAPSLLSLPIKAGWAPAAEPPLSSSSPSRELAVVPSPFIVQSSEPCPSPAEPSCARVVPRSCWSPRSSVSTASCPASCPRASPLSVLPRLKTTQNCDLFLKACFELVYEFWNYCVVIWECCDSEFMRMWTIDFWYICDELVNYY
jgi:hypothetical protein